MIIWYYKNVNIFHYKKIKLVLIINYFFRNYNTDFFNMISNSIQFRIRYSETDQMSFAYHGNYVQYLEMGRIELLREIGFEVEMDPCIENGHAWELAPDDGGPQGRICHTCGAFERPGLSHSHHPESAKDALRDEFSTHPGGEQEARSAGRIRERGKLKPIDPHKGLEAFKW